MRKRPKTMRRDDFLHRFYAVAARSTVFFRFSGTVFSPTMRLAQLYSVTSRGFARTKLTYLFPSSLPPYPSPLPFSVIFSVRAEIGCFADVG